MGINTTEPTARLRCSKNRPSVAVLLDQHYSDGQPAQPPLGPVQPDGDKLYGAVVWSSYDAGALCHHADELVQSLDSVHHFKIRKRLGIVHVEVFYQRKK